MSLVDYSMMIMVTPTLFGRNKTSDKQHVTVRLQNLMQIDVHSQMLFERKLINLSNLDEGLTN